jgi:hypothetical protein
MTPCEKIDSLLPWNLKPENFHELTVEDARLSLDSIPIF